jgi:hypothetical protein
MQIMVKEAGERFPWKQELVGARGTVIEERGELSRVRFVGIEWLDDPVWFATECLEAVA